MIKELLKALENNCQRCDEAPGDIKHSCPFKVEINDDSETLCNCCYDCRNECAMDV